MVSVVDGTSPEAEEFEKFLLLADANTAPLLIFPALNEDYHRR